MKIKKLKAINLIEMTIAFTITSLIMVGMFSIVAKKSVSIAQSAEQSASKSGSFYCWKNWNDELYQKDTSGRITKVNNCNVSVPPGAKNIKMILIGGGATPGLIDKSVSPEYVKFSEGNSYDPERRCIKFTEPSNTSNYFGNTSRTTSLESNTFTNVNVIKGTNISDYSYMNIRYNNAIHPLLGEDFSKFIHKNGNCYLPYYLHGEQKQDKLVKLHPDAIYYSQGKEGNNCPDPKRKCCYDSCSLKASNITNGKLKNNLKCSSTISTVNTTNAKFEIEYFPPTVENVRFNKAHTGSYYIAKIQAGNYTINKNNIGNGAKSNLNGAVGGATVFKYQQSNITAAGGILEAATTSVAGLNETRPVVIYNGSGKISFDNKYDKIAICENVYSYDASLFNLENNSGGEISCTAENFSYSANNGFGLFGATGAGAYYMKDYAKIKSIIYNKYKYTNNNTNAVFSSAGSVFKGGNAMGGAIIITWD